MVKRRHGSDWDRTRSELEKLIEEQTVLKVNYKGSVSYRNAAKVLRGRRKTEQSKCAVKQPSLADWSTGDSALGPVDEDHMEDMEVSRFALRQNRDAKCQVLVVFFSLVELFRRMQDERADWRRRGAARTFMSDGKSPTMEALDLRGRNLSERVFVCAGCVRRDKIRAN